MKRLIVFFTILVILLGTGMVLIWQFVLGGHTTTQTIPSASTQVSQAVTNATNQPGNADPPLQVGKEYTVGDIQYFDNKQWLVAHINPVNHYTDPAIVIMKKQDNAYQTVVGPGTDFPMDTLTGVPADVVAYIQSLGLTSSGNY